MLTFSYQSFQHPKADCGPIIGFGAVLLLHLFSKLQKPSSPVLDYETNFHGCGLHCCNLLPEQTNFTSVPAFCCSYSELEKHLYRYSNQGQFSGVVASISVISSSKQTTFVFCCAQLPFCRNCPHQDSNQEVFQLFGLCFCNFLIETNNFGLGTVLLQCLVSKLQEPPLPGFELRTIFFIVLSFLVSCWSQGIGMPKFGFKFLYPFLSYTNIHTHNFSFIFQKKER